MASEQDQLLASRQAGWNGFARLLFWGTIHVAIITLITVLFYINGPSFGLFVLAFVLLLVGGFVTAIAFMRA